MLGLTAGAVLVAGVALAPPAAAIDDPRQPGVEVTHGPSCGPAVVRVVVTNGTEPHRVALVFDGTTEQAAADLPPGGQTELTSSDVDWGTTVDVSVTVTDPDGAADAPVELGTYTRPSAEDCAAISAPPSAPVEPVPPTSQAPPPSSSPPSSSPPSS
uniref:hypothetical protein n=1 Tax=Modestobacter roseus TaxID=1181884 RepID=UPI0034DFBC57